MSGEIHVQSICIPTCLCEEVIGNIPGARAPNDPALQWIPKDYVITKEMVKDSDHYGLPQNESEELNFEVQGIYLFIYLFIYLTS